MAKGIFSGAFKSADAFGKTMEDVKVKTKAGAFLTLLSFAIILTFTSIEFLDYRRIHVDTSILVDKSRGDGLTLRFNVTFPTVPCYLLSMDVMDVTGEQQRDLTHNIFKTRLNEVGEIILATHLSTVGGELGSKGEQLAKARADPKYCGSCYGGQAPVDGCCNSCEAVRQAYASVGWTFADPSEIEQCREEGWAETIKDQIREGCNLAGGIRVNKVSGTFHFSAGQNFRNFAHTLHEIAPDLKNQNHNFAHDIHHFAFEGDDEYFTHKKTLGKEMKRRMDIEYNPLDSSSGHTLNTEEMFQYFLKVVSTRFINLKGDTVNTHQYSATSFQRNVAEGANERNAEGLHLRHHMAGMPGAFFNFEISPILVVHTEHRQSFAHFLTSMCAIIGGVLTIASILDSVWFSTSKVLRKANVGSVGGFDGSNKLR